MEDLFTPLSLGIVVVGFAAGVLAGMFGVGGAVLTTPGIRALGATPIEAVGSTIPAILPGAVAGAARYRREGLVDWRVGLVCGGAGAVLALAGAWVSDLVDARWLMVLTAGLLGWSGVVTIRRARAEPRRGAADATRSSNVAPEEVLSAGPPQASPSDHPSDTTTAVGGAAPDPGDGTAVGTGALVGVGAAAGFLAGLLGVGGGVVMMPLFTNVLHISAKRAVASSLVAVALFSIPAMISHALLGHINWHFALLLVLGTVPGARVGSRITIGRSDATVRLMLGVFFVVIAVVYGGRELSALLSDS